MTVKIPAMSDTFCPHCLAANHGKAVTVWQVVNEAGLHYECDCCGRAWLGTNPDRLDSKGQRVA